MTDSLLIAKTLQYRTVDCYKCGVTFAVATTLDDNWRRDKTQFYCPNGHPQSYTESEADRLRRELASQRQETERQRQLRVDAEKRVSAQIGINTKLKKRIHAGVCPHCQRTFKQLAAHMKTQHPEVAPKP